MFIFNIILLFACSALERTPAKYVNPFIGTANGGNTFPGATVPFGMVTIGPHTETDSCRSGYLSDRKYCYGFGHVHLSGTGCPELGNVVLVPHSGPLQTDTSLYKSTFVNQIAVPGYYRTDLETFNIKAEMTATPHCSISKYTFSENNGDANIVVDASHRFSWNRERDGFARIVSASEIEGWSKSGNFCNSESTQKVYFVAQFSKPAVEYGLWEQNLISQSTELRGANVGGFFRFRTHHKKPVYVKVGISYVSVQNARLNLNIELPDWEFDSVRKSAFSAWNGELSKILVTGGSEQKTIFYTGLYHCMMHPNIFSDVNGEYPAMGSGKKLCSSGYKRYTVFSLWDTYRTLHPLLTLVYPERQIDMVKSMVDMYRESGWLPKWEINASESYVMVGDPAIPVITDTFLKGVNQFDIHLAYEAMKKSALQLSNNPLRPGISSYLRYGYIPIDDAENGRVWGPVSTTLEYNYADWCLAQLAKYLDVIRAS